MRELLRNFYRAICRMPMKNSSRVRAGMLVRSLNPIRLELGSGSLSRDGWVGLDINENADLRWDLRCGLPFPDGSVTEIHSEHTFEHLAYPDELMPLLKDCVRVLKPGGIISFSVPDMRPCIEAYVRGDSAFLKERITDVPGKYRDAFVTDLDLLSWLGLRNGEHKCLFDGDSACRRLQDAGFVGVRVRPFDSRRDYNSRRSSVYVEGCKAG